MTSAGSISLTISIPTFNRPESLRKCVDILLPQLGSRARLLVVDNASSLPATVVLGDLIGSHPEKIRVWRNTANIGMSANLCRCLELCETEWIWTVGDDDLPTADSVRIMLELLDDAPEQTAYISTSTGIHRYSQNREFRDAEDFWKFFSPTDRFNNLLFISAGLYRNRFFKDSLKIGYHWGYSCSPFLAMLVDVIGRGGWARVRTPFTVDWTMPPDDQRWSHQRVALGLPTLQEVVGATPHVRTAIQNAIRCYSPTVRSGLGLQIKATDRQPFYWQAYFLRLAGIVRGWRGLGMFFLAGLAAFFSLFPKTRIWLAKWRGEITSTQGMGRM